MEGISNRYLESAGPARRTEVNAVMNAVPPADERYARQIRYPAIGHEGQARLGAAHVAIVGVGALGCIAANHLARAGVGRLTLIDRDVVDRTNLQRQMLYDENDAAAGKPKAAAAAERLAAVNGDILLEAHVVHLSPLNAEDLLKDVNLIIDGSDNFSVRYLLNEVSVKYGIPWIYGGAVGASGMTMTVVPGMTPCLACLFPEAPAGGALDTCETAGVLAPVVDTIASIQAMEAIKLLTGNEQALHGALMQIDLWHCQWNSMSVRDAKKTSCPVCSDSGTFAILEGDAEETFAAALCGRNTVQITPSRQSELDLDRLAVRWRPLGKIELNAYLLRLHRADGIVFVLFPDGRSLVMGTDDPILARRLYVELLGE